MPFYKRVDKYTWNTQMSERMECLNAWRLIVPKRVDKYKSF